MEYPVHVDHVRAVSSGGPIAGQLMKLTESKSGVLGQEWEAVAAFAKGRNFRLH